MAKSFLVITAISVAAFFPLKLLSAAESIQPDERSSELDEMLAEAVSRIYPARCAADAEDIEYVTVRYDISVTGKTKNIEVVESSNSCFHATAERFVQQFRYEPKIVDGQAVERKGVTITLTFRLE